MSAEYWYRYDDGYGETDSIHLTAFEVIRRTECGVWLFRGRYAPARFVLTDSRKRFACSTKEAAIKSYIERKKFQARKLRAQLMAAENYKVTGTVIQSALNMGVLTSAPGDAPPWLQVMRTPRVIELEYTDFDRAMQQSQRAEVA